MKFTILFALLPVVLAVPSLKRDACSPREQNPSCNELADKCAADVHTEFAGVPKEQVPDGFHALNHPSCLAAMACMGGPSMLRQYSCIGQEYQFFPKIPFPGPIPDEVISQITGCSGADCSVTPQNFIDLVYSQLSTNWPESPDFVLNNWWIRLSPWGVDPYATISVKEFNTFFGRV